MKYVESDGVKGCSLEIDDVPDMLRGLGELLYMAQGAGIRMEDHTLYLLDYICESIAHDVEVDLKERRLIRAAM